MCICGSQKVMDDPSSRPEVDDDPLGAKNRQYRLDQMLETKMISDILRANNNLKAMKAFRVQSEASYKEKELAEARKREIREPLDAALLANDLLVGKVERREEALQVLRRELLLGAIRNRTGLTGGSGPMGIGREASTRMPGASQAPEHTDDAHKLAALQDNYQGLCWYVDYQKMELAKSQRLVYMQSLQIKSRRDELETAQYAYAERIRRIDADKDIYMNMIESRENKIEKLMEELDEVQEELSAANEALEAAKQAAKAAKAAMEEHKAKALEAQQKQEEAERKAAECAGQLTELREEQYELSERYTDTQTR